MVAPVSFRASDVRVGRPRTGKTRGVGTRSMASVAAAVAEYDAWCEAHGGAGAFAEEAEAVDRLRRALDVAFEDAERSSSPLDALIETARALLDDDPRSSATVPDERWDETRRASTRATRALELRSATTRWPVSCASRISRDRRTPKRSPAPCSAPSRAPRSRPATRSSPCWSGCTFARSSFGASFGAASPCTRRRRRSAGASPPSASAPTLDAYAPRAAAARPRAPRAGRGPSGSARRGDRDRSGSARFRDGGRRRRPSGDFRGDYRGDFRASGLGVARGGARGGARLPPERDASLRGVRVSLRVARAAAERERDTATALLDANAPREGGTRKRERERARAKNTQRHHRCTRRASVSRVGGSGPESGDAPAGGGGDARSARRRRRDAFASRRRSNRTTSAIRSRYTTTP